MLKDGTIIKAISRQHGVGVPCAGAHEHPEPAKWELDLVPDQKLYLCSEHYRQFTSWQCDSCCKEHSGMSARCECGWIRPDRCRRCESPTKLPLIKIVAKRGGHECHSCGGLAKDKRLFYGGASDGGEIVFAKCEDCVGLGTKGKIPCPQCAGDSFRKLICTNCDRVGQVIAVCKNCKGTGEVQKRSGSCSSCNGSGICMASSIRWNLDRIAITDIRQESREELWPYVGQYLCFRCANPDHFFGFQMEPDVCNTCDGRGFKADDPGTPCPDCDNDEYDRQCEHYDLSKAGGLVRCSERLSRLNEKRFCTLHAKHHLCEVCNRRLRLDEWSGRCREHAKCAFCDKRPEKDKETGLLGVLCEEHREYKHFGKGIEKGGKIDKFEKKVNRPENPLHIILVEERILRSIAAMANRADGARKRSRKNAAALRGLERREVEILAKDPKENKDRLLEIDRLSEAIGRTQDDDEVLKFEGEIKAIERKMDEARTFQNRVLLRSIAQEMEDVQKRLYDDYDVLDQYRASTLGLSLTLYRLKELRSYPLWDPKSTPEYVDTGVDEEPEVRPVKLMPGVVLDPDNSSGVERDFARLRAESDTTPRSVVCKSCATLFNPRITRPVRHKRDGTEIPGRGKWLCPNCTTPVTIPMADVRRRKRDWAPDVTVHLPTDNRPVVNDPEKLTCEICRRTTDKLYYTGRYSIQKDGTREAIMPQARVGAVEIYGVAGKNYFACWDCVSPDRIAQRERNAQLFGNYLERRRKEKEAEPKPIEIQAAQGFKDYLKKLEWSVSRPEPSPQVNPLPESMIIKTYRPRCSNVGTPAKNSLVMNDGRNRHIGKLEKTETEEEKKKREEKELYERVTDISATVQNLLDKENRNENDETALKYFMNTLKEIQMELPDIKIPEKSKKREIVRVRLDRPVPPPPPSRWS